jgi:hypothetical protein
MATKKKAANAAGPKTITRHSPAKIAKLHPAFRDAAKGAADDAPTGSCRWSDGSGGFNCTGPVTKAQCDAIPGKFFPGGSC